MKRIIVLFLLGVSMGAMAQEYHLKKGGVTDSLRVIAPDSISETLSVYLPPDFDVSKKWPIVWICDLEGKARAILGMLAPVAAEQGYILATANALHDSLSLSKNMLVLGRAMDQLRDMLPVHPNRMYAFGHGPSGRFASLVPIFIAPVKGIILSGASMANIDVLDPKRQFHVVGVVGDEDYNYPMMLRQKATLDRMKFPNEVLVYEGADEWPPRELMARGFRFLSLEAVAKGFATIPKDQIEKLYRSDLVDVNTLIAGNRPLLADGLLSDIIKNYRPLIEADTLRNSQRSLRKSRSYKSQVREQETVLFNEAMVRDEYDYYLEEDVYTYNFENLGWWKYQLDSLDKLNTGDKEANRKMGIRLRGYLRATVDDQLMLLKTDPVQDLQAKEFLYMLRTLIDPKDYPAYLHVISLSSEQEDYGTALFYLEELLKQGYTDKSGLYALEHTALLRITPEFNQIIDQYLKDSRYDMEGQ